MPKKQVKSIHQRILDVSKQDPKPIMARMTKLQEECGELAAAVLKKEGWKGLGKDNHKSNHENILEECCDIMIVVMSILSKYHFTQEDINEKLEQKLDKKIKLINKSK